jgi:hypothetical protein
MQTPPNTEDLHKMLTRYEGAVSACERDGDDSDEAINELAAARSALLDILFVALNNLSDPPMSTRTMCSAETCTVGCAVMPLDHLPEGSH